MFKYDHKIFDPFMEDLFKDLQEHEWKEIRPNRGEIFAPLSDLELQLMKEADITEDELAEARANRKRFPSLAKSLRELTDNGKRAYASKEELKAHLGMDDNQFDRFIGKAKAENWRHRTYSFEGDKIGFSKSKRDRITSPPVTLKGAKVDSDEVEIEENEYRPIRERKDQKDIHSLLNEWGLNEAEEKKKNVKIVRVGPDERKKMLKRKAADTLTMKRVRELVEEYGIDKTYSMLLYFWYQYKKSGRHSSYYGKFDRYIKTIEKDYNAEPKSVPNMGAMLKKCN